jgi:FXSXX-COOH protein
MSDVESENEQLTSPLIDVSRVRFADLETVPRTVLTEAIERVRRQARGGGTRDRTFESTLMRESSLEQSVSTGAGTGEP